MIALGLSCCAGPTGNVRIASPEPSGIETLKIGLLLDSPADRQFLNASQSAAVTLAVRQINAAGGVNGKPVQVTSGQAGSPLNDQLTTITASQAAVVIGPTDSAAAVTAVAALNKTRTLLISPANGDPALSQLNSGGYYFRTAPSELLQASVLARLAEQNSKNKKVAIVYQAGDYGRELNQKTTAALAAEGITSVVSVEAQNASEAAQKAKQSGAESVLLLAQDRAPELLAELSAAQVPSSAILLSDAATASYGAKLALGSLKDAQGILPGVIPSAEFQAQMLSVDPKLKSLAYAAESYDAVMLAALAAVQAGDSSGSSVASRLIGVSGGKGQGQRCSTLSSCLSLLKQSKAIDYDGVSGPVAFDQNGDISQANYVTYRYGETNLPVAEGVQLSAAAP
nr:ABC transporter substrate-binding protein [Psychromicrobium silvestre]